MKKDACGHADYICMYEDIVILQSYIYNYIKIAIPAARSNFSHAASYRYIKDTVHG